MPFVKKEFVSEKEKNILLFLQEALSIPMRDAKRMIDRKRVFLQGFPITSKSAKVKGEISVVLFEPDGYGIKPFFETDEFVLFDKPSGIVIHPKGMKHSKTLLDDLRLLYGSEANFVHRIDKETSGLIIGAKDRWSERILKGMFEDKEVQKTYLALVKGGLDKEITVDAPIGINTDRDNLKMKVIIDPNGKESITHFRPLRHLKHHTLVEATPLTGRQHQIRIHLHHIGLPIAGDPLYGVDFQTASDYLDGKLSDEERVSKTGAHRLMLHAYKVNFFYKKNRYIIKSDTNILDNAEEKVYNFVPSL